MAPQTQTLHAAKCPECDHINGSISNFILPEGTDPYSKHLICPKCDKLVHVQLIPVSEPASDDT